MFKQLENLSKNLSLKSQDASWEPALHNSQLLKHAFQINETLKKKFQYLAQSSLLAHHSPQLAFISTLLLLFFSPMVSSTTNALLILIASCFTCLFLIFNTEEKISINSLQFSVICFIVFGFVACLASDYFFLSIYGYIKMVFYLLAYFCFIVNVRNYKNLKVSLWVILLSVSIVCLYGLYQWYFNIAPQKAGWDDAGTLNKLIRVYSFLGNPNLLAGYVIPILCISIFFFIETKGYQKIFIASSICIQFLSIYLTYSRGAWLGLIFGIGTAGLSLLIVYRSKILQSKWIKVLLILGFLGCFSAGIYKVNRSPALKERINSIFAGREHSSNNFRINVWTSSIHMIKDYWISGVGIGNKVFQKTYTFYMKPGYRSLSTYNIILEVWVEMGVFGVLIFIFMIFIHLFRCIWGIICNLETAEKLYFAASLSSLLGIMAHGLVDTVWFRPQVQIPFWFLMAMISLLSHEKELINSTHKR